MTPQLRTDLEWSVSFSDRILSARTRAGLTQRELAQRAATSQSVVARIEAGTVSPGVDTLERLVAAAGFELRLSLEPTSSTQADGPAASESRAAELGHILSDVSRIRALSPTARLRELANAANFFGAARRV